MKVLVTGNHDYMGSILSHELLKRCHEVVGIDCDYIDKNFRINLNKVLV